MYNLLLPSRFFDFDVPALGEYGQSQDIANFAL